MFNNRWIYILFSLLMVSGCDKEEELNDDPVPSIEFVSISPASVNELTQPVTVTIRYKDGDGDLGENTAGVKNCFVTDNRIGIQSTYRIQQLAPTGSSVPITGLLSIDLGGQGITDSSSSQQVSFSIYVKDRAGNTSNTVTTGAVTVLK